MTLDFILSWLVLVSTSVATGIGLSGVAIDGDGISIAMVYFNGMLAVRELAGEELL